MTAARVRGLLLLALTGCTALPAGPFERAEQARLRGDLPEALLGYDQVPVQHPRYPEARAAAAGVERRLRQSQELLMQGILLRGEWRESEALAAFEQARETWPGLPGVDQWIAATHSRMELFKTRTGDVARATPGITMSPEPRAAAPREPAPAPPAAQDRRPIPQAPRDFASSASAPPAPAVEPAPRTTDPGVFARLMAVEQRLQRGQLDAALAELAVLQKQWPEEPAVCARLGHLLHQRALLRYGQGALPAALSDWRRVRELCPDWDEVRELLQKAEGEATRPAQR